MSDISRLQSLYYQLRNYFRFDKKGKLMGVKVTEEDINASLVPFNIVKGKGVKRVFVQDTEPDDPQEGDIWIDTSSTT